MQMNTDHEWLKKMEELEDGCIISVGNATGSLLHPMLEWEDYEDGQSLDKRLCSGSISGYRIRGEGEEWDAHFITPQITFGYAPRSYATLQEAKTACLLHHLSGEWDGIK